jgi:anti-sigma factor RsiW
VNCHETRDMIHPYADGELDLAKSLDVEMHIRDCTECAAAHQNLVALRSLAGDRSAYYRAPAGLESRIRASLPQPLAAAPSTWVRHWVAAAAAIVLVVTTTWLATRQFGGSSEPLLASEVTSAHVRSLMAEHLWDVKSTDQHTVKPWFDGKLDFAPDVRDFKDESFALEGGRLDYLAGRAVAALVYRHEKHYINLFIWPAAGQPDRTMVATTQQGYSLSHWVHAGMEYWAISDMSADALGRFAGVVREANQGGGNHAASKPVE